MMMDGCAFRRPVVVSKTIGDGASDNDNHGSSDDGGGGGQLVWAALPVVTACCDVPTTSTAASVAATIVGNAISSMRSKTLVARKQGAVLILEGNTFNDRYVSIWSRCTGLPRKMRRPSLNGVSQSFLASCRVC